MEEISASNAPKSVNKNISTEDPIGESKSMEETKAEMVLNEEPQKKIVKLSELREMNLDPLEYFSRFLDIPEIIFQHFKGNDLKKISEVGPTHYNFIASSKVLMAKIRMVFKINLSGLVHEDCDLLMNSSRQYQNIELFRFDKLRRSVSFVKERNKVIEYFNTKTSWKDVAVRFACFPSKIDMYNFFSSIQSTVECLSFRNVFAKHDETIPEPTFNPLSFPKLKQLKIFHSDRKSGYVREFLKNSSAIENFEYKFYGDESLRTVDKELTMIMLKSFDKLQSLTLYKRNLNEMFEDESWRHWEFKLKCLAMLSDRDDVKNILQSIQNFQNFLLMQNDHLEELTTDLCIGVRSINIILKLPKLKRLSLKYFGFEYFPKPLPGNVLPFEKSLTITELTLKGHFKTRSKKLLLKLIPNVKRLSIVQINQETVKDIIEMNRKFDEIKIHNLRGIDRESLKKISDKISSFSFDCREDICNCLI